LKEEVLNFQIPPLERSPSAQPCSSVSWEQNGYYAAQDFLAFVSSLKLNLNWRCCTAVCYASALAVVF